MKLLGVRSRALVAVVGVILGALVPVVWAVPSGASGVSVTSHFVVTDDPSVTGNSAFLSNGATNGQPHAIVFMALNNTPGGVCGCVVETKPLGVWYDAPMQEWAVFTEDASAMAAAPSFNILVVQAASPSVFVQRATRSNTQGSHSFISSKLLNGNPRASIQITQDFNPGGTPAGTYNPHPVGVRYFPSIKRWEVFNEDNAAIPLGAAFNVLVGQQPSNGGRTALVTVTAEDHKLGTTLVSNPLSNGNPNNVTFVTQVFNPPGAGGIADPHPLEVAYPSPGTKIFKETLNNSDFTTARVGAAFNVLLFTS